MSEKKAVLIVDDNKINRQILSKMLSSAYEIKEAENGRAALDLLRSGESEISAVILDIIMPVMDGFEFLQQIKRIPKLALIPIIVTTQKGDENAEVKALSLGAADFLPKPYKPLIIKQRLANIINLRETASVINAVERDALTGVYNKEAFYKRAKRAMDELAHEPFTIVVTDIERFKIVNEMFGTEEGDKLLKYVADMLKIRLFPNIIVGRIAPDVFALLLSGHIEASQDFFDPIDKTIKHYPLEFELSIKCGVYHVRDRLLSVSSMCDRARLAIERVKGKYGVMYACYDDSLRTGLLVEHQIVSDMKRALELGQFKVYFQPKFKLADESVSGAEALVRWEHPVNGIILPEQFIPLFEKNGFITDLDVYVWNETCKTLREWLDMGYDDISVSVNVSRVDILTADIAETLLSITERHDVPRDKLHLEITESAYTENPVQIVPVVEKLHDLGFVIEMDDFGSGYSSLNMLSELTLDILKIDMRFLQEHSGRNSRKSILNFIISLAKWMKLSVVAEGIESKEQVAFLSSMGCNYGQGFYFSQPVPKQQMTDLFKNRIKKSEDKGEVIADFASLEDIWDPTSQFNILFNGFVGALAIYELMGDTVTFIRGNEKFFKTFAYNKEFTHNQSNPPLNFLDEKFPLQLVEPIERVRDLGTEEDIVFKWSDSQPGLQPRWFHNVVKPLYHDKSRTIALTLIEDVTESKLLEERIRSQREFYEKIYISAPNAMAQFSIDSLECLLANAAMSMMLGVEDKGGKIGCFLDYVAEESREEVGAKLRDYIASRSAEKITLSFEIVAKDGSSFWAHMAVQMMSNFDGDVLQCAIMDISQYKKNEKVLLQRASHDSLTNLLNRAFFEESIEQIQREGGDKGSAAFIMLDLDNFKYINDTFGHNEGDSVLRKVSDIISEVFDKEDLKARMGGDEFAVFIRDISEENALALCDTLLKKVRECKQTPSQVTCSMGIAMSPRDGLRFTELYANSDIALYKAKDKGKDTCCVFDKGK